jgi:shikimate dehydrogenase
VLGSPIAHSLSPALHRAAYAALGLAGWSYSAIQVDEHEFPDFVMSRDPTWRGLSLTMPLKRAALSLGRGDDLVELVGAANTLLFTESGRRLANTDVGGFIGALRAAGVDEVQRATLLGAGGTARAALVALARLRASSATLVARTPERGRPLVELGERLGLTVEIRRWGAGLPPADLVVSTVTAGAADAIADLVAQSAPVIFDVLYHPWPTELAGAGLRRSRTVVGGLDLLVHQAVLQVELMTGRRVRADLLMSAGREALRHRNTA